jgi:hypothetical protein
VARVADRCRHPPGAGALELVDADSRGVERAFEVHGVVVHLLHLELHLLGVALELPRLHLHLRNLHLGPVEAALRVQKIVRELRAVPLGALLQLAESRRAGAPAAD